MIAGWSISVQTEDWAAVNYSALAVDDVVNDVGGKSGRLSKFYRTMT